MADYKFIQNHLNGKWVVSAPGRSHRTNVDEKAQVCPFCPGQENYEEELYRVPSITGSTGWQVRVLANKFPFAKHHEVIIHSPDHHKNWDELPFSQVELILQTYRQRHEAHKKDGPHSAEASRGRQVYIFHNRGHAAGESLPHPHTQLVTIPYNIKLDITPLDTELRSKNYTSASLSTSEVRGEVLETEHFYIFCPETSEWPDEVWVAPKQNGGGFGFIKDPEITDMAFVLTRLIQIFDLRHGHEFPFNFYIAPLKNWYLRLIPRTKVVGGFELGTNIIVNTQDPAKTFSFINEHFWEPDKEKIKSHHQAEYRKKV